MRHLWWKVLCGLLLAYVTVFSFIVPLGPGVIGVDQTSLSSGENTVIIQSYNAHLEESDLQVFLGINDSTYLCTEVLEQVDNDKLKVRFTLPQDAPNTSFNILMNNAKDGTMFFPNAFRYADAAGTSGDFEWSSCPVSVVNQENTGFSIPFQPIIYETIRNLMFHVPMWFTMFFLMGIALVSSLRYLSNSKTEHDLRALAAVQVGLVFCVLGLITGSVWARFTWGAWWVNDPQLNGALVTFLIYVAYIILRNSIEDDQKRAKIAAVFNIFAFVILFVLLMVLPRFSESLHPGKGGNPAFNKYDLDNTLRMVFYPAVIGWILLGYWIYQLRLRLHRIEKKFYYNENV
ncbi:MAG: cytochrome c biogenesis protein CcsA [Flavobacteriales bacterium]|nr:cytochrome c biogenesis protein CcsA [Flavobacteriales bacterium]